MQLCKIHAVQNTCNMNLIMIYTTSIYTYLIEKRDIMTGRGRPKKITTVKDRRKIVQLDAEANFVLQQVKKKRLNFNFSRYVSEHIKQDFAQSIRDREQWLRYIASEKSKELDKINGEMESISEELAELKSQREARMKELIRNDD